MYCMYSICNKFHLSRWKLFTLELNVGRHTLKHRSLKELLLQKDTRKLQLYAKRLQHQVQKLSPNHFKHGHKPFSLQGLYNLHTGHAPSSSSSGFRRLSPPGQPWRSSNTSNITRAEQSVIAAKVSDSKHVWFWSSHLSQTTHAGPNCESDASPPIICWAHASLKPIPKPSHNYQVLVACALQLSTPFPSWN